MNGQAQGTYSQSVPAPVSALLEFNSEIAVAAKNVADLREQARQIANSVFGVNPEPPMAAATNNCRNVDNGPSAAPKVQSVRSAIAELHASINLLRTEIERLTCI